MSRLRGIFLIESKSLEMVYGPGEVESISRYVELVTPPQTRESIASNPSILRDVEVVFGGWGMPVIDAELLLCAPALKAIFYAAGATEAWMTDAVWDRGIKVTTAIDANSIPVAEFTLGAILFSLKHAWSLARRTRNKRYFPDRNTAPGAFGSTVGSYRLGRSAGEYHHC